MSTTKGVSGLLSKLNKSLNKNGGKQANNSNTNDFKAQAEARKKAFIKCKEGKNQFIFIIPRHQEDPFFEWGYHQGLLSESWYTVPCDGHNKNESCIVCNMVEELKNSDWKGNRHIWNPIEQKTEFYAPVINMESEATIAEGPKWLKLPKTVMDQIFEWIKNLEEGEVPFYDEDQPERIIINFSADAAPKDKYKLDKKNGKPFDADQLEKFKDMIQPVQSFFFSKTQEQMKKIVEDYLDRVEGMVEGAKPENKIDSIESTEEVIEVKASATSKLQNLKKGKSADDDLPF